MTDQLVYYTELLHHELIQRREEGCEITEYDGELAEIARLDDVFGRYQSLTALTPHSPYIEPSDLEDIRAQRPDRPAHSPLNLSDADLRDKLLGGWLGRCAGCQLGKPVEGWRKSKIDERLKGLGEYPLTQYFSVNILQPELGGWEEGSWRLPATREQLRCAARDDDQDYTILGLLILQQVGADFSTVDVGQKWLELLPYHQVYTAERQAYRNLVEGSEYPETATRWNPYREWIGAQIRADGWGYAAPGQPERAAEFAFRDAALSHVKNGIYGEMFMAAALAAAFNTNDIEACIGIAAAEIPRKSRFAEMVADCLNWSKQYPDWESAWQQVNTKYGHYNWVHTLNNAALVLLALLYGKQDYERTICYAVQGGWDTDCNGATAGSILGVMLGARALPDQWTRPLNDTLKSAIFGYSECRISDLAEQTFRVVQAIR